MTGNGQYKRSLWPYCSQASDNIVTLTIEDIQALNEDMNIAEGSLDIEVDFYVLTGLPGDFNSDCIVSVEDFLILRGHWGSSFKPCDLDGDNHVNSNDFLLFRNYWGTGCD